MLALPWASLPNEKSVLAHASRNTPTVYPKDRSKSSLYLSGYRLSHVWACSIYLFRQHFISFWRSHFPYSQLSYKEEVRNASQLYWDVALGGVCMSILKIALLGPPEVEHGDHPLTF